MLKKLNLDSTKEYEVAVAALYCSQMLVAFLHGHEHILSIGAEQGDIPKWDDFILEEANGLKHVQIKRQTTDFSNEPSYRNKITKNKRKGQLKDLSPFDKVINGLGEWVKNNDPDTVSPKRLFEIYLPEGSIHIKAEFTISSFKTFCEEHIKDVTTPTGLVQLQANSTSVGHYFNWLNTLVRISRLAAYTKGFKIITYKNRRFEK